MGRAAVVTRSTRITATNLAALFALSQLAALAHNATTRHVRCADHGELIHLDRAELDPGAPVTTDDGVTSPEAGASGGHAHCGMSIFNREPVVMATCLVAGGVADPRGAVVPLDDRAERGSVAIYLLAPKTSPPA